MTRPTNDARRLVVVLCALALLSSACGSIPLLSGGGSTRQVLIDYRHDEFSASFLNYFPHTVQVRPGDSVEFRQQWTGEPHTVTMGTLVDTLGRPYWDYLDAVRSGDPEVDRRRAPDAPGFRQLPTMLETDEFERIVQAAAQPCFRESWVPDVRDLDEPCPRVEQPAFTGRQAYYSSGFVPNEGDGANVFEVQLSDDILPGTYRYYCNYHGPTMSGTIEVVDDDASVPGQSDVNRRARSEATVLVDRLAAVLAEQRAGRDIAPLPVVGGYPHDEPLFTGFLNEFVPATVDAVVGQPVTWTFYGGHTLSFNVPEFFPVFEVDGDGTVTFNADAFKAIGWPERPEQTNPPTAVHIDGGEWDGGGGFHSTSWDFGGPYGKTFDTFTLTFTRPGEYPFACLVHPAMVGRVRVR